VHGLTRTPCPPLLIRGLWVRVPRGPLPFDKGKYQDNDFVAEPLTAARLTATGSDERLIHAVLRSRCASGHQVPAVAELFVGGDGLAQSAESVLATLLHEAAHGLADVRKVQDTSFRAVTTTPATSSWGRSWGSTSPQVPSIGWSGTALADGAAAELVQLTGAITAYRYAEGSLPSGGDGGRGRQGATGGSGGGRGSPRNGVVLLCDCRRRIRVSTTVAALGPITCGL